MKEGKQPSNFRLEQEDASSLSAFIERPVPTENEVAGFEKAIKKRARHQEIDSKLSEIYRDQDGALINVKSLRIKRRPLSLIRWFKRLFWLVALALAGYFLYLYLFGAGANIDKLELAIEAPDTVMVGQEFSYQFRFRNPTRYDIGQLYLEVKYPDTFIFSGSSLEPETGRYGFRLSDLKAGEETSLEIKGRIIAPLDAANVVSARLSYVPVGYSSQFKKEASASTISSSLGFNFRLEAPEDVFAGRKNEIKLSFSNIEENHLNDFFISFDLPEEAKISLATSSLAAVEGAQMESSGPAEWSVRGFSASSTPFDLAFAYEPSGKSPASLGLRLLVKTPDGQSYAFFEKQLNPEIVKSDLNLALSLNGSASNPSVDFGQAMDYVISYNNQSGRSFADVVIMAVVSGDFVDWDSLSNSQGGERSGGDSLTWTKEQIPSLAEIKPGQSGEISFRLKLKDFSTTDLDKEAAVAAYAQYGFGGQSASEGSQSNVIKSLINSDLSLAERILYFNDDNLPVGSGPLPPRVGEATGLRVYWTVTNNLHELSGAKVVLELPSYVTYSGQASVETGSLAYDSSRHRVVWEIGRLPVSVYQTKAEFSLSLAPTDSDRGKILVVSPGASVSAQDSETGATISRRTQPKTTKLEDDSIAGLNNSGQVQ